MNSRSNTSARSPRPATENRTGADGRATGQQRAPGQCASTGGFDALDVLVGEYDDATVAQGSSLTLVTDGGVEEGSVEYWRREAEKSDSHEWCEDCESSYFSHFKTCPHCERKLVTDGGVDQSEGETDRVVPSDIPRNKRAD
ncbi:hypothetical protein R3751_16520, partial [Halorubrum distributum]|uniref:hypothetical protein n=1 Tax=Halorubrum distributum TaxID=29283 RepID=UPI00295568C6